MTTSPWSRCTIVIMALAAVSAAVSVPMAQSVPLSEGAPASGGSVPQSGNCPGGRQQDELCLPGSSGSPAGPNATPTPPVIPPGMPPVTPPAMPPGTFPIAPSVTRPQDPDLPQLILGWATATLHIHDDDQDVIYESNEVALAFVKRPEQNMKGNTQYLLLPVSHQQPGQARGPLQTLSMTWTVQGSQFGCTLEGQAVVKFPLYGQDPEESSSIEPLFDIPDPIYDAHFGGVSRPAFGYLNVVGPDGGDFHSVMIKAFNPDARLIKTCPGDPPTVTKEPFQAGFLLHILTQPNTRENGRVIFQGHQEYDQGNPLDFLKLLPPGAAIPEEARRALQASGSGTSVRYTWTWKLSPQYFEPSQ